MDPTNPYVSFGRVLVVLGLAAVAVGLVMQFIPSFRPGRLPGDISFPLGQNGRVYFPIGTSIMISVFLTLLFALLNRR
jgi:hypothetical protein